MHIIAMLEGDEASYASCQMVTQLFRDDLVGIIKAPLEQHEYC